MTHLLKYTNERLFQCEQEFEMYPGFQKDILAFNEMYKLAPVNAATLEDLDQLAQFQDILGEELEEATEILDKFDLALDANGANGGELRLTPDQQLDLRTEVADWLGDIVVYCMTMAARWGLPMAGVLRIIMDSNRSKLGADGEPIYDDRMKVQKGPHYWKPEPKIRALLALQEEIVRDAAANGDFDE